MSFSAAFVIVNDRFASLFGASDPAVEILWPNMDGEPNTQQSWVKPFMLPGKSRLASIGKATRRWRNPGIFIVQVFSPIGVGEEVGLAIADSVVTAMRGITLSGVRLKESSVTRVGADGQWFQHNVTTPYEYDDAITS